MQIQLCKKRRARIANYNRTNIVNWPKARKELEDCNDPINDPVDWTRLIHTTIQKYTKTITNTEDHPTVDNYLLALWTKRRCLIQRWKKNKHNQNIQRRIYEITQESQQYAEHLAMQHWNQLCDNMNGQLHTARVWHMFRALLGQPKPRHALQRYQLQTGCTMEDLINEI